jgi:phage major head subunit gpT-like protein
MIINKTNLTALFVAFKAAFAAGLGQAPSQYTVIATTVPSTTGTEEYGWLGAFPNMREWIGDRVVHGMAQHGYSIKNKPFEMTVGVPRPSIEDDQHGIYTPMMTEMGRAAAAHPDQLVFQLIKNGPSTKCFDGQFFFDTDHPVVAADGTDSTQSNWDNNSGSGTAWFLLDCSRALKPVIFQDRKKPNFVAKTAETDDNVFDSNEYKYGVDSRCNVGFGFWQLAYGSRKTLDETNLIAAWTAMAERLGDHGRPLGIKPTHLLVPPSLYWLACKLVNATTLASGADNVMKGAVEVVNAPWLA